MNGTMAIDFDGNWHPPHYLVRAAHTASANRVKLMGRGRRPVSMRGVWLMLAGLAIAGSALVLGFIVAPDAKGFEGDSYRIIFWHVPAAWTSFLTFGMLFVGSLAWVWK